MATADWPADLPQSLPIATAVSGSQTYLESRSDAGGKRRRGRFGRSIITLQPPTGSMIYTHAQLVSLLAFYDDTLNMGVDPFFWRTPMPTLEGQRACWFTAASGGHGSRPTYLGLRPGTDHTRNWRVTFALEVLPLGHPGNPLGP